MSEVYEIVPDSPQIDPELRDRVLDIIIDSKLPIKASQITKMLRLKASEGSVTVRKAITELVHYDRVPIIATPKGYMLAKSEEQIDHYLENLEARKNGIDRRIADIDRARIRVQAAREGYLL